MTLSWEEAVRSLLSDPGQRQTVLDCYYDQPAIAAAARYESSEEWREVRSWIPRSARRAVDLGSGHGITAYALGRAGLEVLAVEPDASGLVGRGAIEQLAAQAALAVRAAEGTAESIPAADASFDVALARQVLHHTRDLARACREIHRVLRPGGIFIALRDHVISSPADLPRFFDGHPLHHLYGGENAFLLREYMDAVSQAGFVDVKVLRAFDSVVNYAPHTRESLREAFIERAGRVPLARPLLAVLLKSEWVFDALLATVSALDRRPGRLVSLVCRRPDGANG